MPIDEGVNVDLQFLILEIRKQARASLSAIEKPTRGKRKRIHEREDHIEILKNTLENKSYISIHNGAGGDQQIRYFKALITIAASLARCAHYFHNIAKEMRQVSNPACFAPFRLHRYYAVIDHALDIIYPALADGDLALAKQICDDEKQLDDLFDVSNEQLRDKLRHNEDVDDMLILLNVTRYLERAGDALLNIGEAILAIHVGEKIGITQFRDLEQGLRSLGIDIRSAGVAFSSIMNTRSGSRVACISADGDNARTVFYKEGRSSKITDEITGLRRWQKKFPGMTPAVLWHSKPRKKHATILLEHIAGEDLLGVLVNNPACLSEALDMLTWRLGEVWQASRRNRPVRAGHIRQLLQRREDVQFLHSHLFALADDLDEVLARARKLEKRLVAPFSTLIHGDFNVDNILYRKDGKGLVFVDLHRSGNGDYVQDVAVFLVSNFRVPLFNPDVRCRLNEANRRVFECAAAFAHTTGDTTFEARLALGLVRSLITSTRFLLDERFSAQMFERAMQILRELLEHSDQPQAFQLRAELYTYHGQPARSGSMP